MDKVTVINLTYVTQHVGVVRADGAKDSVQIMPKRRVELRVGMTVDPAWLGTNIGTVKIMNPHPVPRTYTSATPPSPSIPTPPAVEHSEPFVSPVKEGDEQ